MTNDLPVAPWVLLDELTVNQTCVVLDRLTSWLNTHPVNGTTRSLLHELSAGEAADSYSITGWLDAIHARLEERIDAANDPHYYDHH